MSAGRTYTASGIRAIYTRRARRYAFTSRVYGLLGYRLDGYRRAAIEALALRPGDTVVEIGCGTGANFEGLVAAVGPTGTIVGVDLTPAMLERARIRVARRGWPNVRLVEVDAARFEFPPGVGGVFSSFALTLVPAFDEIIRKAACALRPGGRVVIVDFKAPSGWPSWLLRAVVLLLRPFGVTLGLASRHPWEAVARHCDRWWMKEYYLRTTYVAVGEQRVAAATPRWIPRSGAVRAASLNHKEAEP